MEKYLEIKTKIFKEKHKIICITFKQSEIGYSAEAVHQIVAKLKEILEKGNNYTMLIDTRPIMSIDKKMVWEGASVAFTLNSIMKDKVRKSCMIIQNTKIKILSELVLKVHKPVIPFKICDNNQNAMNFITEK